MTYLHAGLFESCHKTFKRAFQLTSLMPKRVMSEFIEKENRQITYSRLMQVQYEISRNANSFKQVTMKADASYLVKTGSMTTLQDFMRVLKSRKIVLSDIETASEDASAEKTVLACPKCDCLTSL